MSKEMIKKSKSELEKVFNQLEAMDPSNTKKYVGWMKKQAELGSTAEDIIPTVEYFHKNIQRFEEKDIFKYKTLKQLEDIVKDIELVPSNTQKRKEAKAGVALLFKDNRFELRRIDEKDASVYYGRDTRWCITMNDAGYFEEYQKNNNIFYFIEDKQAEKKSPLSKIAYVIKRDRHNEITNRYTFNSQDDLLNEPDLDKVIPDIPKEIMNKIEEDIVTVPKPFFARLSDTYDHIPEPLRPGDPEWHKLAEVTEEEVLLRFAKEDKKRLELGEKSGRGDAEETAAHNLLLEKSPFPPWKFKEIIKTALNLTDEELENIEE